ncbi:MAG: transcription termination/antitermination factor NusG [Firmicutes bacterium]|jgi:transcriptional antiterminator NusG|nr:transcription termination/antitermination factor NusG [Bacillota bacterium]
MAKSEWYVVHTYSGYENKVKDNLEKRVETMEMTDKIFNIEVPTQIETEIKDAKKKTVKRKLYPGYVLVEMIYTDESWYVVRNTPGVTGFISSENNKPIPMEPEEVERIIGRPDYNQELIRSIDLQVGDKVVVIEGPFVEKTGTIQEINLEEKYLKVNLSVFGFGREVLTELALTDVKKE